MKGKTIDSGKSSGNDCLHRNRVVDPHASGALNTWYWVCPDCGKGFDQVEMHLPHCPFQRWKDTPYMECRLKKDEEGHWWPCVELLTSGQCGQKLAMRKVMK